MSTSYTILERFIVMSENKSQKNESASKLTPEEVVEFVLERFGELKNEPSMKNLVHFHTINKFLIMAHSPKMLNVLGNLVANHRHENIKNLLEKYETNLKDALKRTPTISSHTNVLSHVLGHFSNELNSDEKSSFLISIKHYEDGKITLSEILGLVKSWISKFDKDYLTRQTYFLLYYEPPQTIFFKN